MPDPVRFEAREMLVHAAKAVGKVDLHGSRGATLVTMEEIEAMACLLRLFGVVPAWPGKPLPETLIVKPHEGETS